MPSFLSRQKVAQTPFTSGADSGKVLALWMKAARLFLRAPDDESENHAELQKTQTPNQAAV